MILRRGAIGLVITLLVVAAVVLIARGSSGEALPSGPPGATPSRATPSSGAAAVDAAAREMPLSARVRHSVVALGDSVPAGSVCGCRPFPEIYGSMLGRRSGAPVSVDNLAVGGLDTSGLIRQLGRSRYEDAVRDSDIVLVTIGANDFGDHYHQIVTGRCGRDDTDCVADEVRALRAHLATVLARVRALRGAAPTTVLVTGYWNVFKDGHVAVQQVGKGGLRASLHLTARANAVIESVSKAEGATYVDLFAPFNSTGQDITSLLAADGDHPSAAGHRLIARALIDAGLPRTT